MTPSRAVPLAVLRREAAGAVGTGRSAVPGRAGLGRAEPPPAAEPCSRAVPGVQTGHWGVPRGRESSFGKFHLKQGKKKKKEKLLDGVTLLRIPGRGCHALGAARGGAGRESAEGLWWAAGARQRPPGSLAPARSPPATTSWGGGSDYFVAFKNSTVTTFFYD